MYPALDIHRHFTTHKWLRQTAYIFTHNFNNLEHIANNCMSAMTHTDVTTAYHWTRCRAFRCIALMRTSSEIISTWLVSELALFCRKLYPSTSQDGDHPRENVDAELSPSTADAVLEFGVSVLLQLVTLFYNTVLPSGRFSPTVSSHLVNGIYPAPDIHEHFTIHKGYGTLRTSSRTSTILSALWPIAWTSQCTLTWTLRSSDAAHRL